MSSRGICVLCLTTEPENLARPDTTGELAAIQGALNNGDTAFRVANVYRANRVNLMEGLEQHEPEVVHFLGHGSAKGLMIEDRDGTATLVSEAWLIDVFARCRSVRLVVLNACNSVGLAQALVSSSQTTILGAVAWSDRVNSDDARELAATFYKRLAGRKGPPASVGDAFSFACDSSGERPAKQAVLALRKDADFRLGRRRSLGLIRAFILTGAAALLGLASVGTCYLRRQPGPDRASQAQSLAPTVFEPLPVDRKPVEKGKTVPMNRMTMTTSPGVPLGAETTSTNPTASSSGGVTTGVDPKPGPSNIKKAPGQIRSPPLSNISGSAECKGNRCELTAEVGVFNGPAHVCLDIPESTIQVTCMMEGDPRGQKAVCYRSDPGPNHNGSAEWRVCSGS